MFYKPLASQSFALRQVCFSKDVSRTADDPCSEDRLRQNTARPICHWCSNARPWPQSFPSLEPETCSENRSGRLARELPKQTQSQRRGRKWQCDCRHSAVRRRALGWTNVRGQEYGPFYLQSSRRYTQPTMIAFWQRLQCALLDARRELARSSRFTPWP